MAGGRSSPYPSRGFIISLVGGIFILLGGIYTVASVGSAYFAVYHTQRALTITFGVVASLLGVTIIYGASQMRVRPESARRWGGIVMLVGLISLFNGGGFVIGLLLAVIGGCLAVFWRSPLAKAKEAVWSAPGFGATPQPMGGQKLCASCGLPNREEARFCSKCGTAFS